MKAVTKTLDLSTGVEFYEYEIKVSLPHFVDINTADYERLGATLINELENINEEKIELCK